MSSRPIKRSLTLKGHRTSVTLEDIFWQQLRAIARRNGCSINALAAEIDAKREIEASLASALRTFILSDALDHSRSGG